MEQKCNTKVEQTWNTKWNRQGIHNGTDRGYKLEQAWKTTKWKAMNIQNGTHMRIQNGTKLGIQNGTTMGIQNGADIEIQNRTEMCYHL